MIDLILHCSLLFFLLRWEKRSSLIFGRFLNTISFLFFFFFWSAFPWGPNQRSIHTQLDSHKTQIHTNHKQRTNYFTCTNSNIINIMNTNNNTTNTNTKNINNMNTTNDDITAATTAAPQTTSPAQDLRRQILESMIDNKDWDNNTMVLFFLKRWYTSSLPTRSCHIPFCRKTTASPPKNCS